MLRTRFELVTSSPIP